MIAYKNGCKCEIWKIPTKAEIERYPTIKDPPMWVVLGEKAGCIVITNHPHCWSYVYVVEENGKVYGVPGDWIIKFGHDDYSIYQTRNVERNFRVLWRDVDV